MTTKQIQTIADIREEARERRQQMFVLKAEDSDRGRAAESRYDYYDGKCAALDQIVDLLHL